MKLAIIVAAAKNGVIGRNNQLPWHLPQDLKYFKSVTLGKPVIMGRKTYESIGKPLPGRPNIVITRSKDWSAAEGVIVARSFEQALFEDKSLLAAESADEAIVIGGAEIYRLALQPEGDAFFRELDSAQWCLESRVGGDAAASIPHEFLVYVRVAPQKGPNN